MKIYVAGPYSSPTDEGRLANVERALAAGVRLMDRGHTPFIPHLSHYTAAKALAMGVERLGAPAAWQVWLDQDKEWLRDCDAMYFLGSSKGADLERSWALEWGMPVYTELDKIPDSRVLASAGGHPRFCELLREAWALHKFKSRKYGSAVDPLANLHSVERMGYKPYQAALIELNNINMRVCNLVHAFEAGDDLSTIDEEPLRNALMDNAAFSYLALLLLEESGLLEHA